MTTPEEVEVARRNLIAELREGVADGMDVSADMVRDLIEALEAPRPLPTREQIDEVLQLYRVGVGDPRLQDPQRPGALANYRRKLHNALLALFTGGEE